MSYNWAEFLQLAEALQSDPSSPGPSEAALRSAASRAYYAAFHCAVNFARKEGFEPDYSGRDHGKIQSHFRTYGTPNQIRKKISLELNRLYNHRRKADYIETLRRQPNSLASQAIGMAKSVFRNLSSL